MEVVAIVEFKRDVASTQIFCIVIGKFSLWKELSSIILFIVDKSLKVGFHCTILSLNLAINLKVKNNKKLLLDS